MASGPFGYYGIWSSSQGTPDTSSPMWQNPDLKTRLGLRLGGGLQDQNWIPGVYTYEQNLTAAGIPYTVDPIDGGHEWYTWRQMLYDYLRTVAFRHTSTSVSVRGPQVQAQVTPDTTELATPTGTVQFFVDGNQAGRPVRLAHGIARTELQLADTDTVTAVYSGDAFYNSSTTS